MCLRFDAVGVWRSLVARTLGVGEVARSNRVTPISITAIQHKRHLTGLPAKWRFSVLQHIGCPVITWDRLGTGIRRFHVETSVESTDKENSLKESRTKEDVGRGWRNEVSAFEILAQLRQNYNPRAEISTAVGISCLLPPHVPN